MLPAVEPAFGGIRLLVVFRRLPRVLLALALVSPRSFGRRQLLAHTLGSREASADSRASTKAPTHHRWSVRLIGVSLNRACSIAARDGARSDAVEDAAQGGGVVVESLASGACESDRGASGRSCVAFLGDQIADVLELAEVGDQVARREVEHPLQTREGHGVSLAQRCQRDDDPQTGRCVDQRVERLVAHMRRRWMYAGRRRGPGGRRTRPRRARPTPGRPEERSGGSDHEHRESLGHLSPLLATGGECGERRADDEPRRGGVEHAVHDGRAEAVGLERAIEDVDRDPRHADREPADGVLAAGRPTDAMGGAAVGRRAHHHRDHHDAVDPPDHSEARPDVRVLVTHGEPKRAIGRAYHHGREQEAQRRALFETSARLAARADEQVGGIAGVETVVVTAERRGGRDVVRAAHGDLQTRLCSAKLPPFAAQSQGLGPPRSRRQSRGGP